MGSRYLVRTSGGLHRLSAGGIYDSTKVYSVLPLYDFCYSCPSFSYSLWRQWGRRRFHRDTHDYIRHGWLFSSFDLH